MANARAPPPRGGGGGGFERRSVAPPPPQMSGVLAVVAYGLVFASPWGKVRVDPGVTHFLHEFWGMVGHLVNTMIFTLAGVLIMVKTGEGFSSDFWTDLGYGILLYVLLTAYRGVIMFGVIPLFSRSQYGYTWRDALVITWGGLRGAVSLALAVAVASDASIVDCKSVGQAGASAAVVDAFNSSSASGSSSGGGGVGVVGAGGGRVYCIEGGERIKDVIMFHVCLVVALTLVVNASTSGALLKRLGMTKLTPEKASMLQVTLYKLKKMQLSEFKKLLTHPVHSDVNWEGVQRLANFDAMVAQIMDRPPPAHDPLRCWHPSDEDIDSVLEKSEGTSAARRLSFKELTSMVWHSGSGLVGATPTAAETMVGGAAGGTPLRGAKSGASKQKLGDNWRRLFNALAFAAEWAGDLQARLLAKRTRAARFGLLERLKAHTWSKFEEGIILPMTATRLNEMLLDALDALEGQKDNDTDSIVSFKHIEHHVVFTPRSINVRLTRVLESLGRRVPYLLNYLTDASNRMLIRDFDRGYDLAVGYLLVHDEILEEHEHGTKFSFSPEVDAKVRELVEANISAAAKVLAELRVDFPKISACINTIKAARMVLNAGKAKVDSIKHHGGLADTEAARLTALIDTKAIELNKLNPLQALPPTNARRPDGRRISTFVHSSAPPPPPTPSHRSRA